MDEFLMAKAYEDMTNSMAFKDFMQWVDDRVEDAEVRAAAISPLQKEHFEAYFMAWQERKKFSVELKQRLEDCKSIIKEKNERPSNEYGDPGGSEYQLPGY